MVAIWAAEERMVAIWAAEERMVVIWAAEERMVAIWAADAEAQVAAKEMQMENDEYVFDLNLRGGHILGELLTESEEERAEAQAEGRRNGMPVPDREVALRLLHAAGLSEVHALIRFKLDAARAGNASRFVNHEPEKPNLFVQMVATPGAADGKHPQWK
eukprot:gene3182-4027_t